VIGNGAVVGRILLACALGGLIGLERELKDQPAGLRTHLIVGLGACLFTLASAFGFAEFAGHPSVRGVSADPTRIASQIVVGIGFLGGGTILRHGGTVRGLTTAATLWVTAAIGLAAGLGFYVAAVVTTGVAIFTLRALKPLETWIARAGGSRSEPEPPESDSG
jgi:putative Mg2+ transporter-C (MgtC) family protein